MRKNIYQEALNFLIDHCYEVGEEYDLEENCSSNYYPLNNDDIKQYIEPLKELIERYISEENLEDVEKGFNELGYTKTSRGHINIYTKEYGDNIRSSKNIMIYPDSIVCFWKCASDADLFHPDVMTEEEARLALAELKCIVGVKRKED